MKNLNHIHLAGKEVSAVSLFKGELGTAIAIQIDKNDTLKGHVTKSPALLLCVNGIVTYEDDQGQAIKLQSCDYVNITPNVRHWLYATEKTQLVLLK